MDTQEHLELLAAQDKYKSMYLTIENAGFEHLIDECVDRENVYPLRETDGAEFWNRLYGAMINSVGSRLEELGYDPNDFNVPY